MGQVPSQKAPVSCLGWGKDTARGAACGGSGHLICWLLDFGPLTLQTVSRVPVVYEARVCFNMMRFPGYLDKKMK